MKLNPVASSLKNIDFMEKNGENVKNWLKEDSVSKSAITSALYLAGPKGVMVAKGIEIASTALSLLDSDRDKATEGYSQSNGKNVLSKLTDAASSVQPKQVLKAAAMRPN